jgi:hypothetical protein
MWHLEEHIATSTAVEIPSTAMPQPRAPAGDDDLPSFSSSSDSGRERIEEFQNPANWLYYEKCSNDLITSDDSDSTSGRASNYSAANSEERRARAASATKLKVLVNRVWTEMYGPPEDARGRRERSAG